MPTAQADLEKAVAEGRAREAEAAKLAADRLEDRKKRRTSHAAQATSIKRQQKEADRTTKAEKERQGARDAADQEACARDEAGIAEHRHALRTAEEALRRNTEEILKEQTRRR